jgi:hypothetical protein
MNAEDERHERQAEGVVAPDRSPRARHGDIAGQQICFGDSPSEVGQEFPARRR